MGDHDRRTTSAGGEGDAASRTGGAAGRRTRTSRLPAARGRDAASPPATDDDTANVGGLMPYLDQPDYAAQVRRDGESTPPAPDYAADVRRAGRSVPPAVPRPDYAAQVARDHASEPEPPGPRAPVDPRAARASREALARVDESALAHDAETTELTPREAAAVERMRANPLFAAPAAETPAPAAAPTTGLSNGGSLGDTPGQTSVGVNYSHPDGTPGAQLQGSVNLNGEYDLSIPLPGNAGAITFQADPQAGNFEAGGRVGSASGTHAGGNISVRNGELRGGEFDGQIGSRTGANARATAAVDQRGRVTRLELAGQSARQGPRRIRFGGKLVYQATFGSPVENPRTHQFDVTVSLSITVDLSVTARSRVASGTAAGGGVYSERVVRHFGSQEDADAWVAGEQPELDGAVMSMLQGRLDPETAMALEAGTEVEVTDESHRDYAAEAGLQLGLRLSHSRTLIYRQLGEQRFQVGVRTEDTLQERVGGQTAIAGAQRTFEQRARDGRILEFDVSTEGGRRALEQALDHGSLPPGARGDGWRVVETSTGTTDLDRTAIDAFGSHGEITRQTDVDVVTDERGNRDVRARGSQTVRGDDNQLDAVDLVDDAGTTSTVIAIDDTGAAVDESVAEEDQMSAQQRLAAATGTEWHMGHGDRAGQDHGNPHAFHAQSHLSDGQMVTLWRRMAAGRGSPHAHILATQANEATTLAQAAHSAPSAEEFRPAVARFITATGAKGSQFLRAVVGGDVDYELTLEGSNVFQGAEGRAQFADALEHVNARFATNPGDPAVLESARALLHQQQSRVSQIADVDAFPLPPAVRRHELALQRPLLESARTLVRTIEQYSRGQATETARQRSAAEVAAELDGSMMSSPEAEAAAPQVEQHSHDALAAFRGDEQRMLAARGRAVRFKEALQNEGVIHHTPSPGNGIPPIELVNGFIGTDDNYAAAHRAMRQSDQILDDARVYYQEYETLRAGVPDDGVLDPATIGLVQQIRRTCWSLATSYGRALDLMEQARQHYLTIRREHPGTGIWGPTHAPPPAH